LEVEKHLHHFPSNKHDIVDMLTKRIINKILHEPMVNLHNGTGEHHDHETRTQVHLIRHLFGLDKKSEK
jgi:glutamyl-tRNA reductase